MAMAIFLVPSALLSQGLCPAGQETVSTGNYSVTYYGNTTDTVNNTSSWFYCVEESNDNDISHTVVAFPTCLALSGSASSSAGTWGPTTSDLNPGDGSPSFGTDGSTGIYGLKFDVSVPDGGVGMYYFTLDNIYEEGTAAITMKAGGNTPTVSITGPSQSCSCAGNYSIDGNVFNSDIPIGLNDVELKLRDDNLQIMGYANTNPSGDYLFENVATGSYTIDVNELTIPSGVIASSSTTGLPVDLSLSCEPATLDISYRNQVAGIIGDLVWHDYCLADGIPDATEMTLGLEGAKVNIFDSGGTFIASAYTDSYGIYRHDGLAADDYTVELDLSDPAIEAFIDAQIAAQILSAPVCPPTEIKEGIDTIGILAEMTTAGVVTDALPDGGSNYGYDFGMKESSLDVELANFSYIVKDNNTVEIQWTSSSEIDFSGYQIQLQRDDETSFTDYHFVPARGGAATETTYDFELANLDGGKFLVRLKMIDTDGLVNYSSTLEFDIVDLDFEIVAYPNPAKESANIRFGSGLEGAFNITLYDQLGREVKNVFSGVLEKSEYLNISVNVSDLPNGIYFVYLEFPEKSTFTSLSVAR